MLVHDAARCLVRPESIRRLIADCRDDAVGGLLAMPVADTLKRARRARAASTATVPRERDLGRADAADVPHRRAARRAARRLRAARPAITDEASAIEATGHAPRLVRGDFENLKVTWPEDFALAERLLRSRACPSKAMP